METLQGIMDEAKIKGYFSISQIIKFTEKCLKNENNDPNYDSDTSQSSRKEAHELVNNVIESPSDGTPDDYFNYAVTFARESDYTRACDILKKGLDRYGANVDLLSVFLLYATMSSKDVHYEMCEEVYKKLKTRRSFWQWRAYDFSIDYLLDKIDRGRGEPEELKAECLKLASEFQSNLPVDERGYVAEAQIYSIFGEKVKEKITLEKVLYKEDIPIGRAGVSLALIYLEQRDPDMAVRCMERVMKDMPNNNYTNPSPIWLLLMKSKIAKLMKNWKTISGSENEQDGDPLFNEIVKDWDKVKKISDATERDYNSTKKLVEFIKAINDKPVDDDEL